MENPPRHGEPPRTILPPGMETPPDQTPPPRHGEPPQTRHPPPDQTPPRHGDPPQEADSGIRSTIGRYASYWNAFLFSLTSISPVEAQSPTDPWLIQFCLIKLLSFSCSVIITYWMKHREYYFKGDRLDPIHFEHYPILEQGRILFTAQPRSRYRSVHFTVNLCPDIRTFIASAQTTFVWHL